MTTPDIVNHQYSRDRFHRINNFLLILCTTTRAVMKRVVYEYITLHTENIVTLRTDHFHGVPLKGKRAASTWRNIAGVALSFRNILLKIINRKEVVIWPSDVWRRVELQWAYGALCRNVCDASVASADTYRTRMWPLPVYPRRQKPVSRQAFDWGNPCIPDPYTAKRRTARRQPVRCASPPAPSGADSLLQRRSFRVSPQPIACRHISPLIGR